MTEYLTEQEQVEQLKKWLRIYGLPALFGVLVGVIIFYGWNYYQSYHLRTFTHASRIYDEMLTDRVHNNNEGTLTQAQKIVGRYPSTPYGEMAALMLSHEAVAQKNYSEALKQLSWVLNHSDTPSIRQIARLRIARIHLTEQHPEEAMTLLQTIDDKSFMGLIDEVLGDAHLAMGQSSEAQESYKHALQELPNADEIRPLLEMKLDNLVAE